MANENYEDFIKALISVEKGINDKDALGKLYTDYMENNSMTLLNDEFDYMIDELRENGQLKENATIQEEDNDLVNVVGNIVGDVEVVERENKNGEPFKVANFSIVSNDENGDKFYTNCSAYGEKSDIPKEFKQGDFVKVFGQIRPSMDDNGKEYSNVRVLSSKLLKAKEQMKNQVEDKDFVLGAIKKYKAVEQIKPSEKKHQKKLKDKICRCGLRTARLFFLKQEFEIREFYIIKSPYIML
ncbi:DNA-binding protein [Enterococcus cecorum]|nr:DNA-binding protein [Enterococcus cecorum]